jgi:hypothetical protein
MQPKRFPWHGVVAFLLCCAPSSTASAAECGDPTGVGHASVTNGVVILRSAAGLSSSCKRSICDVDLDGHISVSDGVLTLRVAAAIPSPQFTCAEGEVGRQVGRFSPFVTKIQDSDAAGTRLGAMRLVRPAGVERLPCAKSGHIDVDANGFEAVDCNNGATITNGRVTTTELGTGTSEVTFAGFIAQYLDDGERVVLTGRLVFTEIPNTTNFSVDGEIGGASSSVGDFTDHLTELVVSNAEATPGQVFSGTFRTEVTRGIGPYAHLLTLESQLFASGLRVARLERVGGGTAAFVLGGQSLLCEPCTATTACGDGLSCRSCVTNCSASAQRCAVGDPTTSCEDGDY